MARFIEEKEVINSHINSYLDRVTDYSKYLEGSPTFVTYYSKDVAASTADIGLNGVAEFIGTESPIKYNKVVNYPIYNVEEMTADTEYDEEDGSSTEIESTAILLPDSGFKPFVDDFFVISYDKRKLLFRISDVQISSINDRVLYKITYYHSSGNVDVLEENQVNKTYQTVYDNIGPNSKQSKIVIEQSVFLEIEKLVDKKEELRKLYVEYFYNEFLNTFICEHEDELYYDNYLMKFIMDNSLFIQTKTFMKNIHIEPINYTYKTDIEYNKTIFNAVHSKNNIEYNNYYTIGCLNIKNSIFEVFRYNYPHIRSISYLDKEFEGMSYELINTDALPTIITKYLANDKDITENILNYKVDTNNLLQAYLLLPVIFKIINNLIIEKETMN